MASSAAARPIARAVDTVITFSDIRATMTSGGMLPNTLNCCDDRRSRTWCDQRAQRPHGRGLARPVRPQEPEHLTARDTERHVGHGGAPAENLGQVTDLDAHWHGPWSLPSAGRSRLVQAFIHDRVTAHFRPPPRGNRYLHH
jgi:hypothetical protein